MSADVLCLSHLRWGFVYQRPNHLMARCARDRRVFFVEEPIFDSETARLEVTNVENGLHLAVPHLPPGMPADVAEQAQRVLLDGLVERANVKDPLMWFYTPMALGYARDIHGCGVVYDCMDELSHFRGAPPALVERERELFGIADLVFTGGQSLYEAKRPHHQSVHAFPSSVDAAHFRRARARCEDPVDQSGVAYPRIGFFGVVDERMDLDLLDGIAQARPHCRFVVIGPVVKIDPATLPQRPNIVYLGPKKYEELPAYLAGWDVAMMPFARNDATKFISPTKTLEYLAAGKPVVSTSIRDVVRPYGEMGLAHIADDPQAFVAAIDAALTDGDTNVAAREAYLAQTSWDRTWDRMNALIGEAIARRAHAGKSHKRVDRHEEEMPCSTT